jgi:nitroimidazol reductase NimA-like FMN-containing flavoprotein (pyridoxamine 5'-phosphate oxidase superfamily)
VLVDQFARTARTRVRRLPKRGHYDRATVHAVLDAGVLCHVGYVIDGQPHVTPTCHWRHGDRLYWHGSSASRMLRHLKQGVPACVTVTHLDGFVLARSGFHHSVNYRSVMAFGSAQLVPDAAKLEALEHFVERLFPGRWDELRPPTAQEVKATTVVWMDLDEVSAKIRTGPPVDDEEDYDVPVWAGVLPVASMPGAPEPDPRLAAGIALPGYLTDLRPPATGWAATGARSRSLTDVD